jgi:hypothetical protein
VRTYPQEKLRLLTVSRLLVRVGPGSFEFFLFFHASQVLPFLVTDRYNEVVSSTKAIRILNSLVDDAGQAALFLSNYSRQIMIAERRASCTQMLYEGYL